MDTVVTPWIRDWLRESRTCFSRTLVSFNVSHASGVDNRELDFRFLDLNPLAFNIWDVIEGREKIAALLVIDNKKE